MQPASGAGIVLIFKQCVLSFVWWLHMRSWKWSSCTCTSLILRVRCGLGPVFLMNDLSCVAFPSQQISVTTFREIIKLLSQSVFWLSQIFFHQYSYSHGPRKGTPLQGSVLNKYSVNIYEDKMMNVIVMKISRHGWNILFFNRCCKILFIQTMSTCTPSLPEVLSLCQHSECFHTPFTLILSIVIFRPLLTEFNNDYSFTWQHWKWLNEL